MTRAPTSLEPPLLRPEARLVVRDLADVPPETFDDDRLERLLCRSLGAHALGATWVRHRFLPRGMSLVCLGVGLRVVLHTWPERARLSLDVYGTDPELETVLARCLDALVARSTLLGA